MIHLIVTSQKKSKPFLSVENHPVKRIKINQSEKISDKLIKGNHHHHHQINNFKNKKYYPTVKVSPRYITTYFEGSRHQDGWTIINNLFNIRIHDINNQQQAAKIRLEFVSFQQVNWLLISVVGPIYIYGINIMIVSFASENQLFLSSFFVYFILNHKQQQQQFTINLHQVNRPQEEKLNNNQESKIINFKSALNKKINLSKVNSSNLFE